MAGFLAVGAPGEAHPAIKAAARTIAIRQGLQARALRDQRHDSLEFRVAIVAFCALENVPAQVLVLDDIGELFLDVSGIHFHVFLFQFGRVEGNFL